MPDTYTGFISTGKLQVDGNVNIYPDSSGSIASSLRAVEINAQSVTASTINVDVFNFEQANLDISGNFIVQGDTTLNTAYIARLEVGTLIVDTSGDIYQNLDILGDLTVGGTISTDSGFSIDLSGNVMVAGNTTLNTAYIARLEVGTLVVDTSGDIYQNLDILGDLAVGGTVNTDSGFSIDHSGNVVLPGTVNTNTGFTIDVLGNVVLPGTVTTDSGFTIDASGNVTVSANTSVQAFVADGQVSLNHNVYVGENIAILGGEYLGGSLYANGGVVIGDSSNGNGVTLDVSGTTLSMYSKDSSGVKHPASLVVDSISINTIDVSGSITADSLDITGLITTNSLEVATSITAGSLNVSGFTVDISGNVVMPGTVNTNTGFTIDLSGNVTVLKNTTLNTAYIARLEVGTLIVDTSGDIYQNLDILGDLAVGGTVNTDSGFSIDDSGNVVMPGTVNTNSGFTIDILGNVVLPGTVTTDSGFTIDASGNVTVAGNTSVQAFVADGQVSLIHNVYVGENIAILGGEYLKGSLYANGGVVVGDSSNGNGVSLDVSGTVLSMYSKDSSGIKHPASILVDNISLNTLIVSSSITAGSLNVAGFVVDVSGNVVMPGTVNTNTGFSIDHSGNVVMPGAVNTDSGFTIDVMGNVVMPGTVNTNTGFSIDASGNVTVAGNTSVQAFSAGGQAYLSHNLDVAENTAIEGGFYVGGSIYTNNGIVVGDGEQGDGVTMDVSGTVLNMYSEDSSGNINTIDVNVNGDVKGISFNVQDSYAFNTFTDSSGTFINIDSSNNSIIEPTTTVPNNQMVISINGVKYSINLFKII